MKNIVIYILYTDFDWFLPTSKCRMYAAVAWNGRRCTWHYAMKPTYKDELDQLHCHITRLHTVGLFHGVVWSLNCNILASWKCGNSCYSTWMKPLLQ